MGRLAVTALDEVQHPHRPGFQEQLPDCNCRINGVCLGAESCTCYAAAVFVDRATGGSRTPSGCSIRKWTGDMSGGTTLNQVAIVIRNQYGIAVSVYTGSSVVSPAFLARQIRAGRPAIVQGGSGAFLGTPYKVTDKDVNHAECWPEVRGGSLDTPAEVLIYDSCADHRRPDIDQGPTWVPWSLALRFAAYLRPNGEGTARLGPGKIYCAIGPDTEPHVRLLPGARQAHPFPDRVRAGLTRTPIHNAPKRGTATTTRYVPKGRLLRVYQYVEGEIYKGDRTWAANDDGTEFVHFANITHEGGTT